jgi:hypothetical protein
VAQVRDYLAGLHHGLCAQSVHQRLTRLLQLGPRRLARVIASCKSVHEADHACLSCGTLGDSWLHGHLRLSFFITEKKPMVPVYPLFHFSTITRLVEVASLERIE